MRGIAAERFCVRNSGVTAVVEVSTIGYFCLVYSVNVSFFIAKFGFLSL